jgi:hypothetical protein
MASRLALCLFRIALVLGVAWSIATAALDAVEEAAEEAQSELETAAVQDDRHSWLSPSS